MECFFLGIIIALGLIYYFAQDRIKARAKALSEWFTDLFKDPSKVQARKIVERASQFCAEKDYAAALADLNDAIRLNGNDAALFVFRAGVHRRIHDRDHALADLEKAIQLDPQSCEAHSARAAFFTEVGDFDKAIASYTDLIRFSKKDFDAEVKHPDAKLGSRWWYGQAFIEAHQKRAELLIKKGDLQQAICDFDALRVSSQQRGKGYRYLNEAARYYGEQAVLYAKLGDPVKAFACCRAAFAVVEEMPPSARSNPGLLSRLAWRVRQEFREFRLISNDSGVDGTVYYSYEGSQAERHGYQAIVHEELGDWDKAFSEFQQALGHGTPITFLEHLWQAKKNDNLILAATEWIRIGLTSPSADPYRWRGRALYAEGDFAGAIRDLTQAIEIESSRLGSTYTCRGDVHLALGAIDDAITDYTQAIEIQRGREYRKESAEPYRKRATAYEKKGDTAKAEADRAWLKQHEMDLDWAEIYAG